MRWDPVSPPYRTRLEVLFAARAERAVILRRGPKTHYRLVAWDLATDTFTPGQWMKGLVVPWDLSPDGRTLIYWAAQYHPSAVARRRSGGDGAVYDPVRAGRAEEAARLKKRGREVPRYLRTGPGKQPPQENTGTWTAISTVPYFTALAMWPAHGHWTGGGIFAGDSRIVLFEPQSRMTPVVTVPIPARVNIQSVATVVGIGSQMERSAHGPAFAYNMPARPLPADKQSLRNELEAALKQGGLQTIEWAHAIGEDVLLAGDGAIYRVPEGVAMNPSDYVAAARLLIDLSNMQFEPLRAPPEAMRWPA